MSTVAAEIIKISPKFYGIRKFIHVLTKARQLSLPGQNGTRSTSSYYCSSNLILYSHLISQNIFKSNLIYIYNILHVRLFLGQLILRLLAQLTFVEDDNHETVRYAFFFARLVSFKPYWFPLLS